MVESKAELVRKARYVTFVVLHDKTFKVVKIKRTIPDSNTEGCIREI